MLVILASSRANYTPLHFRIRLRITSLFASSALAGRLRRIRLGDAILALLRQRSDEIVVGQLASPQQGQPDPRASTLARLDVAVALVAADRNRGESVV